MVLRYHRIVLGLALVTYALQPSKVGAAMSVNEPECRSQLDVVAVVDGSDSILDNEFLELKEALVMLVQHLDVGDETRFGAIVYSSSVGDKAPLSNNSNVLAGQIRNFTHPQEGTATYKGIREMITMMNVSSRPDVPMVGIVITDGRSKLPQETAKAAETARSIGIEMFAVGVGSNVNDDELEAIASSNETLSKMDNFQQLLSNIASLVKMICKVDGGWSNWTVLHGDCSELCGSGTRISTWTRTCTDPPPSNGGKDCEGSNTQVESQTCFIQACPDGCDKCRWLNGIGYKPVPGDCSKYIQCDLNNGPTMMPCAQGLYWDQDALTCNWPSLVECTQKVQVSTSEGWNDIDDSASSCDGNKRQVVGNNAFYKEFVEGLDWVTRPCPHGTTYISSTCTCENSNDVVTRVCKPELYLPFDNDLNDHSGHEYSVQNEYVTHANGYASFTALSGLRITRFSNMDFLATLRISFLLHSAYNTNNAQAIVSNADCNLSGSIYILKTNSDIEFRVINSNNVIHSLSVPCSTCNSSGGTPQTQVQLTVNAGVLTGKVGSSTRTTAFTGNIGRSHCAMQIGRAAGFDNFVGKLDEFRVFLCIP